MSSRQQFLERTSHVLALHFQRRRRGAGRQRRVPLARARTLFAACRPAACWPLWSPSPAPSWIAFSRSIAISRLAELDEAARFLNENFHGWSIDRIRTELARRLEQERNEYDRLMRSVEELCRKGAFDASNDAPSIFIEGVANLIAGEADRDRLRQLAERARSRSSGSSSC